MQTLGRSKALLSNAILNLTLLAVGLSVGVQWGLLGAAAGVAVATLLTSAALTIRVASALGFTSSDWVGAMRGPMVATAAMALLLLAARTQLPGVPLTDTVILVALGVVSYSASLLALEPALCRRILNLGRSAFARQE